MEAVTDFIFLGSKSWQMVTAAMNLKDTCSLEEKPMTNRDKFTKKRRYYFDKFRIVIAKVFPSVTYGCESWTIKKGER